MAKSRLGEQLAEINGILGSIERRAADAGNALQGLSGANPGGAGVAPGAGLPTGLAGGVGEGFRIGSGGGSGASGVIGGSTATQKAADALGESVGYVEKLIDAGRWAGVVPLASVLAWDKQRRDALIAAWERAGSPGGGSGRIGTAGAGGGGGSTAQVDRNPNGIGIGDARTVQGGFASDVAQATTQSAKASQAMLEEIRGLRRDVRGDNGLSIRTGGA